MLRHLNVVVLVLLGAGCTTAVGDETSGQSAALGGDRFGWEECTARPDSSPPHGGSGYRIVWDDFRDGFTTGTPEAKWFYFAFGPFVGNDGIETTSRRGLRVVSPGVNPITGRPAFTSTLAQEDENGGLPGGLDHVKWLVYANHLASSGVPGFDAEDGYELSCESVIEGRTWGTRFHPFGDAVDDHDDDLRLANFAVNGLDFESLMVLDFLITNETVYAFYERLPFAQGGPLGDYAAFSSQVPVARNHPGRELELRIGYDRANNTARWYVNGRLVHTQRHLGVRPPRHTITLDHGGVDTEVQLNQLACGMGHFSLLDAHRPTDIGLVRLSNAADFYYDPDLGEPNGETFVDDESLEESRLFGQGAETRVRHLVVSSRRIGGHHHH
jgi:hypothetical protein